MPQVLSIGGSAVARRPARTAVLAQSGFITRLISTLKILDGHDDAAYSLDDLMSLMKLEDELRMEMTKVMLS